MKTEVKDVSQSVKEVEIEIEAEKVKEIYKKVSQQIAKYASVPGFRKGFAPVEMVRIHYKDEIKENVVEGLVRKHVSQALESTSLVPVAEPKIYLQDKDRLKLDGSEDVTFRIVVEVIPEVPLIDVSDIELFRKVKPVRPEDVNAVLDEMVEKKAVFIPIEGRKAQKGDTIFVDLEGTFVDESSEEKIELKEVEILLGSEDIDEKFTENLEGVEQDEVKEFTIEYPENFFSPQLAGRKVKYSAKVLSVGQIEKPQLNDEFAREQGYESLEEMKRKVEERLKEIAQREAERKLEKELMDRLLEKYKLEVPPSLVLARSREILSKNREELEKLVGQVEQTKEDFYKKIFDLSVKVAEREIKEVLLLSKFADEKKVEVTEEEIEQEIQRMSQEMNLSEDVLKNALGKSNYKGRVRDFLLRKKVISSLLESAKVKDGEWKEEKEKKK